MRLKITIALLYLLVTLSVVAQDYPKRDVDLEILADQLFGFQDLDLNYEDLYENMAQLLSNRVNLTKANAEELRFLNLLSEEQIQNLLQHRQKNGDLLSVYELQAVQGFDLNTIYRIIPFVTVDRSVGDGSWWRRIWEEENNYLIIRYEKTLETKAGFKESASDQTRFRGTEDEMYIRFRTSRSGDFSIGFTIEKDAGEQVVWNGTNRQYGFDYNSFHAQIMNKGKIKNLIIGDYQTQFAQGLLLGGSFGYGKGSETVSTVRRSNLGILPYTSVNEAGYKRGAAITYELSRSLFISSFYSLAWRDATVLRDDSNEGFVSSFQTTGLHRNENELANRHQIQEQNYGAVLNYKSKAIDAGIIFNSINFNIPVNKSPQAYNQFTFEGQNANNLGAFFNYTRHNFTFFSEVATTIDEGVGLTAGLLGSITPKLDIAIHIRNYQRNFQSLYSNAFAENSLPQNESGIYWGWKYSWNRKYSASGYADLFSFPWLRYGSYSPSNGHEWLLRFNYQPSKNILIYLQAREEIKVQNISQDSPGNIFLVAEGSKRNYWVNCDYGLSQKIKLKTRAQFSTYTIGDVNTKGMALIQDISVDFGKLTLIGRYALFDTDDYNNRQYVYERDVWLAYSLPSYSGSGLRKYVMAQYTFNKYFSIWIRFATMHYNDQTEIGSGADSIDGDKKRDVRIQMRVKF